MYVAKKKNCLLAKAALRLLQRQADPSCVTLCRSVKPMLQHWPFPLTLAAAAAARVAT